MLILRSGMLYHARDRAGDLAMAPVFEGAYLVCVVQATQL